MREQIQQQFRLVEVLVIELHVDASGRAEDGSAQVLFEPPPQRFDRRVDGSSSSISSKATMKTLATLIFTVSFIVYSSPGRAIQLQPTAIRWRASSAE